MATFYPSTTTRHDVGLATVVLSPHKLLEQFQRVHFTYLPLLNLNCNIDLPWRLIPERYQGLGMANYALVSLAWKLSFLQCNWVFFATHSTAMMKGCKSFMVEVGLYGNTMSYNYKRHLMQVMSNTWLENVWKLISYFNVGLNLNGNFHLKPV
jgi:hypothetical protein